MKTDKYIKTSNAIAMQHAYYDAACHSLLQLQQHTLHALNYQMISTYSSLIASNHFDFPTTKMINE